MNKFIFCNIDMFSLYQSVLLIENGSVSVIGESSLDDLAHTIVAECNGNKINQVKLKGNKQFLSKVRENIHSFCLNYDLKEIHVEVID